MLGYFISPQDLWNSIATHAAPQVIDVRRADVFSQSPQMLPGAQLRDASKAWQWSDELDVTQPIVVACKAGHDLSQMAVAQLRADGFDAQVLHGGYEGWAAAGLPFVTKPELDRIAPVRPSVWVTRRLSDREEHSLLPMRGPQKDLDRFYAQCTPRFVDRNLRDSVQP